MGILSDLSKSGSTDQVALIKYLNAEAGIQIRTIQITPFSGGYSNLTYLLEINESVKWVLRMPPKGADIKSGHDMSREYKILNALYPLNQKVPKPVLYCSKTEVLGATFYIMEYVSGYILRSEMNEVNPDEKTMRHIFQQFMDTFVDVHQLDYVKAGLGDLGIPDQYAERQISGWTKRYFHAKTDDIKSAEKMAAWLREHIPPASGTSLIHNDFKYDNLILDIGNSNVTTILDWEMSTIGDPLMDLGSSLGYWVNVDDPDWLLAIKLSPTTIPGNPSREGLLQEYAVKSGIDPGNGVFYYVYGLFKLAVIAQQIYARYVSGHTTDARFAGLNKVVDACATIGLQSISRKRLDGLF
ncbi:MAG: phosphotransferase family protein [Saprospiraceae bacterium]|nr:phosphotransferase family protein [Saprospiraceae bacterium]